tara:strand:- start:5258 stop:5701 length:444 start_codon:yes stop_codon:yes gene_type:complete
MVNKNGISDLVVRLNSKSNTLRCIFNLDNISILKVLENEGLLTILEIDYLNNYIYIEKSGEKEIHYKMISKPSKKVYGNLHSRNKNIQNLGINHNLGLDFYIMRTSKGIMTNKKAYIYSNTDNSTEINRAKGLGGEILLRVSVSKIY